jgi:ribosomal protein S12 methylthiotransferase accessory factor
VPELDYDPPDYHCITDQVAHLKFWCDHRNKKHADFLFSSEARAAIDDGRNINEVSPREILGTLAKRVANTGHRVYLVNVTTVDVDAIGLSVVRALLPGFHPLALGHEFRALGGKRLWTIPQALGYRGISTFDNPIPHPYP